MAVQGSDWYLERINTRDVEKYYLNENGSTEIGRNVRADITTCSEFSSRDHCSIRITAHNEIVLTDKVRFYCFSVEDVRN